jgi:hypothetical protein
MRPSAVSLPSLALRIEPATEGEEQENNSKPQIKIDKQKNFFINVPEDHIG